jgi:dimethylaniline monooxygenase (N-oxide forming)
MANMRVLVIGAGASGLTAVKCCLDEGLDPVCIERTSDIAGLWNYSNSIAEEDVASVMKSTVINTSKEMIYFSDFPIPAEFPNFMHNSRVLEYMRLYADEFKLMSCIRFKTEV